MERNDYQAILWLDGVRIVDDSFASYEAAKVALDECQKHHMRAHGRDLVNFDRMIERKS